MGIKVGYSPIGFVRCGRSACRVSKIVWKMGKETGGKKMEDPHSLKSNEMAECSFQPQQPLVCDTFKNCEGLSRVAFMDGNGVVMLGTDLVRKEGRGVGRWQKEVDALPQHLCTFCHDPFPALFAQLEGTIFDRPSLPCLRIF